MSVNKDEFFYCFGDSICFGQHVPHHKTWVSLLSESLYTLNKHAKIILNNLSINGNTSRQALERLSYDILPHQPDYVLIQFALNDCNYWKTDNGSQRVSEKAFKFNLIEIVEKIFRANAKNIFLLGTHPTNKGEININSKIINYDKEAEKYNMAIEDISTYFDNSILHFIDMHRFFVSNPVYTEDNNHLLLDGIHLSDYGHTLYYTLMKKQVLEKLKK